MNLGWIRSLFTLSKIEKDRIAETNADPRRIEAFQDIENIVHTSIDPPVQTLPTSSRVLNENAQPKAVPTQAAPRTKLDQDLIQTLLKQRHQYQSSRILRAGQTAIKTWTPDQEKPNES